MKHFLAACAALAFASCVFEGPVYESGFTEADPALLGVWNQVTGREGDPEKAVFAPLDGGRYLLCFPTGNAESAMVFEARPLRVGGDDLLQLRLVAALPDKLPGKGDPAFTLLLVDQPSEGNLQVRALDGKKVGNLSPEEVRGRLASGDGEGLFGTRMDFSRE